MDLDMETKESSFTVEWYSGICWQRDQWQYVRGAN